MRHIAILFSFSFIIAGACATADGDDQADDDVLPPIADAGPGGPDAPNGRVIDASPNGPDSAPLGGPCDPILQDCAAGQKCALIVMDTGAQTGTVGCALNGDKAVGQSCSQPSMVGASDDCVSGSHCVFGTCHEMCVIGTSPCAAGGCVGVNNLEMQFDICLPNCDPLLQNCGAGDGCYLTGDGPVCAAVVGAGGAGVPPGGSCTSLNDCQAGSGCFNTPGTCLKYCNFSLYPNVRDPDYCALGEVCGGIVDEDTYGVCI